jgi:hypothetical protein
MSIGYPDYSRTQAEAGNQLGSFFGQKQTDPSTGVMDAIGYAFLTIQIGDTNGNVHHFDAVITWYSDHGATNIVNTSDFAPVPGSNVSYQIPVVSRYVNVTMSHQVALDTENVGGIVFGSNVQVSTDIVGPKSGPFIMISQSVPATTNVFSSALYTKWGPATLSWFTNTIANCVIQLEYYDIVTAGFIPLVKIFLATAPTYGVTYVNLPPNPMRVGLYNLTAGAVTFGALVTIE